MSGIFEDFEPGSDISLTINPDFASKYEEKKRTEELGLLRDKYGEDSVGDLKPAQIARLAKAVRAGVAPETLMGDEGEGSDSEEDSTSEEEDEHGEMVTPAVDAQIMRTLQAIRSKDTSVYLQDTSFFDAKTMAEAENTWKEKQRQQRSEKPIRMKDMTRKAILEHGGMSEDEDEEDTPPRRMTHVEEQEMLRMNLKKAAMEEEEGDDQDLFVRRDKTQEEQEEEEEDYKRFLLESMASKGSGKEEFERWQNYREDPSVGKDEAFLMDYILNRGWVDQLSKGSTGLAEQEVDLDEDEEAVDAADDFESQYNFRFEEPGAGQIITHSRQVAGSVRRPDDRRKKARQTVAERKEEEKAKQREELKRLKNLKKAEILKKLRQIQEITGNDAVGIDAVDLEADFNPDDYDGSMGKVFNEDYYQGEEAGKKPEWDDDIDISDIVKEEELGQEEGAPISKREAKRRKKAARLERKRREDGEDVEELDMDADYTEDTAQDHEPEASSESMSVKQRLKSGKHRLSKREFEDYIDEFYQLDYEDTIGDLPTRFRYTTVDSLNYGLTPEEILLAEDKELNQHVSVKKLAPYRPEEVQVKDHKKYGKKHRVKEFQRKLAERLRGSDGSGRNRNSKRKEKDEQDEGKKKKKKKDSK
ncbi:KRI1-like family C-terminal-domain-containing protein [Piptocephalis cylindrospora]|uniref:KRI1-like family C-terminal-domain-containing protein n=1 Tax=Piptocephalis cylindrospora TaxID=1907219 RepID=A0A4P9Y7U1_9FUNG|nr:KRI1-like family C-terminal-domain-containing protein [Piptocephalis cylindrospora]|eukprot:RKP15216.1 KRI1-like family C-terminal-domain-containing protein [Piptocephalis cylindrospora]